MSTADSPVTKRGWFRRASPVPSDSSSSEPAYRTCWSTSGMWELSLYLGKISLAIVTAVGAIYLYDANLIRNLNPFRLLTHISGSLSPGRPLMSELAVESVKASAARDLRQLVGKPKGPNPSDFFTIGSAQDQVRRVQGAPTRRTDTTWTYGDSRVYFVNGRVVGWKTSAANPLRAR